MEIINIAPSELVPYSRNAKRHPAEQVRKIANSIKEFGFRQPIVVDNNNVVVIGHGRLLAAKRLKLDTVPVTRAEDLSDEQIRLLRLADNSVAESEWNIDYVQEELAELDMDVDFADFGLNFEFESENKEKDDEEYTDSLARSAFEQNVFENQERMQFESDNYYGIPSMAPTQTTGTQFVRFCDWNEIENPEDYIAHFYYDDVKFMQAWRNPDKYLEKLRKFKAVVAPDFSSYTDFPVVLQILGAYRRQWVGAYWQAMGIDVIPDCQWGDEETYKWCFEGIPKNATVAISSLGVKRNREFNGEDDELFRKGFDEMMNRLNPTTILWYGDVIEGCSGNIIHIPSFYEQKREMLNRQAEIKKRKL